MKVLMYGWEFPPMISGGLGVACYAIVQSLCQLQVDIKLVLPDVTQDCCPILREYNQLTNLITAYQQSRSGDVVGDTPQLDGAATQETGSASRSVLGKVNPQSAKPILRLSNYLLQSGGRMLRFGPYSGQASESVSYNYNAVLDWEQLLQTVWALPDNSALRKFVAVHQDLLHRLQHSYTGGLVGSVLHYALLAGPLASQVDHQIIYAHDWLTALAALEGRSYSQRRVVLHIHALETDRSSVESRGLIYQIERFSMQQADHIITVSNFTKRNIVRYYQIDPAKISVVYNGVLPLADSAGQASGGDDDAHAANLSTPSDADASSKIPMVLFLGRITNQKGPYYFIEIARLVLQVLPETQFVFAGTGDLLYSMIERVAQLRLGSNIHFTGFLQLQQVQRIYGLASVYVMPSVSEPFGISALEAAQHGLPVIVSKQSGVAEVMPNILKVDFWDSQKFANQIIALLQHQALGQEMTSHASQDLTKLTWNRAAQAILRVYHKLLQHSDGEA